jgi:hypothetical protein
MSYELLSTELTDLAPPDWILMSKESKFPSQWEGLGEGILSCFDF